MEVFISNFIDMFTTRDFAIITWGLAFLGYFLLNKNTSGKTKSILKSIFSQMNNSLFVVLSAYFVVLTILFHYLGSALGDWDYYMIKDAALWFLFSGLPFNVKYIREKAYFGQLKDTVLDNFKVALLFDCVFSTYTFSYVHEMVLVMIIIGLVFTLSETEDKEEHKHVNIAAKAALMGLGFLVVLYVFYATYIHHSEVFSKLIVTELTLPFYYTFFFIVSAILLKSVLKVHKNMLPVDNPELTTLIHIDSGLSNLCTKMEHLIEKLDIIHFFFERNKHVVKKIYNKAVKPN